MSTRAAQRYAKAMLSIALEQKNEKEVFSNMSAINETYENTSELKEMLLNPVIKGSDKAKVLSTAFQGQNQISTNLIKLLLQNKRINLLGKIATSYIDLYHNHLGNQTAIVTTATPITEELKEKVLLKLKELTQRSEVVLNTLTDPDILGGFILRVGDKQYNASVRYQLNKIKREISLN